MDGIELVGVFLHALATACVNLRIVAADEASQILTAEPAAWYPATQYADLVSSISRRYANSEPIKEQIGIEMMRLWFEHGGRSLIASGADFVRLQTGSQGYRSVIRGPEERLGDFTLELLDEGRGVGRVRSSTPFDRTMERGILLGGMKLTGDLSFVDVDNSRDPSVFELEFHV